MHSEWLAFLALLISMGTLLVTLRILQNVREVHLSLNSRLDMLLDASGKVERAAGVAEGVAAAHAAVDAKE